MNERTKKEKKDISGIIQEMTKTNRQALLDLSYLMGNLPTKYLISLSKLIYNERTTRKYGLTFYQKVYYRYMGNVCSNYMSNFIAAYVVDANQERIRLISKDGKIMIDVQPWESTKTSSTIYTVDRFKPILKNMIENELRVDPYISKFKRKMLKGERQEIGHIASIEEAHKKGFLKEDVYKEKKIQDLVAITRQLEQGFEPSDQGREYEVEVEKKEHKIRKKRSGDQKIIMDHR